MHVQPVPPIGDCCSKKKMVIVIYPFKVVDELNKKRFTTNPNLIYTLFICLILFDSYVLL